MFAPHLVRLAFAAVFSMCFLIDSFWVQLQANILWTVGTLHKPTEGQPEEVCDGPGMDNQRSRPSSRTTWTYIAHACCKPRAETDHAETEKRERRKNEN